LFDGPVVRLALYSALVCDEFHGPYFALKSAASFSGVSPERCSMSQRDDKVEVIVEEVVDSAAGAVAGQPSVVIQTEALVDGESRNAAIEVLDADAPAVAVALLNAEVDQPPESADLPIALQCLAAGVMHAAGQGKVRLHLQFDSGQVLPIEMSQAAAGALSRALSDHTAHPIDSAKASPEAKAVSSEK
jgi:hypothetical protein